MAATVEVIIEGRDNASSAIGGIGGSLSNLGNIVTGIKSAFDLLAGAFNAVVDFGAQFTDAAGESQLAVANLEATLVSMGNVTGLSSQELQKMAGELQNVTRYSDEAIINAEAMLLTFGNIGGDVFPRATEVMVDMAAKFGSLDTAAIQLGKALNDPIEGVGSLQRIGVKLSETQKEQIANFMATGDIASAQGVILSELERQVGGLAEAYGETFPGKLDIFKNRVGEVQETIGKLILEGLTPFLDKALEFTESSPIFQFFSRLGELLGAGATGFEAIALALKGIGGDETPAGIVDLANAFLTINSALENGATPLEAFRSALDFLSRTDGPLAGVAGFISDIVTAFETGDWSTVWDTIKDTATTAIEGLFVLLENKFNEWVDGGGPQRLFNTIFGGLGDMLRGVDWNALGSNIITGLVGAMDGIDAALAGVVRDIDWTSVGQSLGESIKNFFSGSDTVRNAMVEGIDSNQSELIPALGQALEDIILGAAGVTNWDEFETKIKEKLKTALQNLDNAFVTESQAIGKAIIDGIKNGLNQLDINAQQWVDDHIVNPIKDWLGIASPSTVFYDIGKDIVQGLINGLASLAGGFVDRFRQMIDDVLNLPGIQTILDLLGISVGGSTNIGGAIGDGETVGGRTPVTGDDRTGLLTGGLGGVVNNFYGPVYFGDMSQLGYDCPSPHPLMTASGQSLLATVSIG